MLTPLCSALATGIWSPRGTILAAVGEHGEADLYDPHGVLVRQVRRTPVLTLRRSADQGASALAWVSDDGRRLLALANCRPPIHHAEESFLEVVAGKAPARRAAIGSGVTLHAMRWLGDSLVTAGSVEAWGESRVERWSADLRTRETIAPLALDGFYVCRVRILSDGRLVVASAPRLYEEGGSAGMLSLHARDGSREWSVTVSGSREDALSLMFEDVDLGFHDGAIVVPRGIGRLARGRARLEKWSAGASRPDATMLMRGVESVLIDDAGTRALVGFGHEHPEKKQVIDLATGATLFHLDPRVPARTAASAAAPRWQPTPAALLDRFLALQIEGRNPREAYASAKRSPWQEVALLVEKKDAATQIALDAYYGAFESSGLRPVVRTNGRLTLANYTRKFALAEGAFDEPALQDFLALVIEADELCFQKGQSDPVLLALARSRHLRRLFELSFSGSGLSPRSVTAFAESGAAPQLRVLAFHWEAVEREGVEAIARSKMLSNLTELAIDFALLEDQEKGIRALSRATFAGALKHLSLRGNDLTAKSLAPLLDSPLLAGLESLDLSDAEGTNENLGDEAVIALASSKAASNLRRLDLTCCGITDRAVKEIRNSSHLRRLDELVLAENDVTTS